jgi:hypothetical protein
MGLHVPAQGPALGDHEDRVTRAMLAADAFLRRVRGSQTGFGITGSERAICGAVRW